MRTGRPAIHGLCHTPTYNSWSTMRARCQDPKHPSFKYYGARGVEVCARWQSFVSFLEDMGKRPSKQYVLSREGDKGNYEPNNCSWKLRSENEKERIPAKGEKQHLTKLKENQIPAIRRMYEEGMSFTDIGKNFKIHRRTVARIIKGETWKHVP